ncbi:glycoside hydrolase superfamily [Fennellomyces sp. T-0311]|nr:glycoside hydrolase superfamily [Fennellomyces sp. T-0311]
MKTSLLTTALGFLVATSNLVQAKLAIDTFDLQPDASFECAHNQGYEGAAIGCYEEGESLSHCPRNYFQARSRGFKDVDLSLRPCAHRACKSPEAQVTEFTTFANRNKMGYRYLWLHVEDGNWWSPGGNRRTLEDFKAALDAASETTLWKWGIKTSQAEWKMITGSTDWVLDGNVPLWYSNYDGSPSFEDFTPFGGWTTPFSKQYAKDSSFCDATFSESYYE